MTKRFMITTPTAETLKEDELQTFYKMRNKLENPNSFIGMLFNQELTDWFTRQVKNDFSTDIMKDLAITERRLDEANEKATEYFIEKAQLEKKLKRERGEYETKIEALEVERDEALKRAMDNQQHYLDLDHKLMTERTDAENTRKRFQRALARFRKIAADREAKWEFMLGKLTN